MPNFLFNRYGNYGGQYNRNNATNNSNNIASQLLQLQNNPGAILDIMLQNQK